MRNVMRIHSAAITRWSVSAMIACCVLVHGAHAQPADAAKASSITGVYNGSYTGDQGEIKFKLSLTVQDNGTLAGTYTLSVQDGADTKDYTCDIKGRYIAANRMVQVLRGKWQTQPPTGMDMLGMNGVFDPSGGNGAGQISGKMRARPGPQFQAVRDADESAKWAAANPAKTPANSSAGGPATPRAPIAPATPTTPPTPGRQPAAAGGAVPAAASPSAPAVNAPLPMGISGVYTGEFQRSQGNSKLKFSIKATEDGSFTALFTFDPPNRRPGPSITYKLTGKYDPKAHDQWGNKIEPFQFTTIEPIGSGAQAALDALKAQGGRIGVGSSGNINGLFTRTDPQSGESNLARFTGAKDRAQPADLDQAMAAQGGAATAPPAPVVRRPFEGVYNGTYGGKQGGKDGPETKFKLMLWVDHESRTADGKLVQTDIAALLTVFPTDGSGDDSGPMPCTAELHGFFGDTSHVVQLTTRLWEPRMTGMTLPNGLEGKFDPGGAGVGGGGAGYSGSMTHPTSPAFQGTRDAVESASMNVDRLRNHIYPGIVGVFNGTYTRENEPPSKFKLTIKHNGDGPLGLEGLATVYLPSDAGTKPYTYDLTGVETPHGQFELRVHDWVTTPPADFKNFKAMGFCGRVMVNDAVTSATMKNVPPASSMAEFYLPQFEATYEATESADINATIAAQKAIGNAEQAAALKARDEMMKNAQPKELASKDLVHKSRQYWEGYKGDMIREIFDGGFGAAMDENDDFQKVFCTYVDNFSAKCPECLPADHKTVTITMKTNRKANQYGQIISEDVKTFTVDVDSRFADTYVKFHAQQFDSVPTQTLMAVGQPGGTQHFLYDMMAMATDMQKFFADHPGKSAAMRQLTENFLRAINGNPSLQQANGKIDGAEAESDKDALPGRYARFVDGANAYFIERAKANPTKFGHSESHDTALCQRLAELYEFHMTRDEEYYYANDFANRFVPIMGQRASCPDPAWPQLHPDVEKAIGEVK